MNASPEILNGELAKPTFSGRGISEFSSTLNHRVGQYFKDNQLSRYATKLMVVKSIFFLAGSVFLYSLILFGGFSEPLMLIVAALLGFMIAGIGFNIGHDAVHGSYSANSTINKLMSLAFQLNGADTYTWNKGFERQLVIIRYRR